jgi:hypothetical protein
VAVIVVTTTVKDVLQAIAMKGMARFTTSLARWVGCCRYWREIEIL